MHFNSLIIAIVVFSAVALTFGQYETSNYLCGGWLRGTNGTIQFKYELPADDPESPDYPVQQDKVCVWTVSPMLPSQSNQFTITIEKLEPLKCDTGSVGVTAFDDMKNTQTTYSWNCGEKMERVVTGPLFVVVFTIPEIKHETGFQLTWTGGEWYNRTGLRTMQNSFGKTSVAPLPYFAGNFMRNEIATFAFPKGNNTRGFKLEMNFDSIRFDKCNIAYGPCFANTSSIFLVNQIQADGTMILLPENVFYEDASPQGISSSWGLFILVWGGDFWGAGGSFQMEYNSVRETNDDGRLLL